MKLRVLKIKEIQEFVSLIPENKQFQGNERKNAAYVVLKEGYDVILNIYEDNKQLKSIAMEYFQGVRDMIVNEVEIDNYYEDFYDWNSQMDCGDFDDLGDCGDFGDCGDLSETVCNEGEIEKPNDDGMERNQKRRHEGEKKAVFPESHVRVNDRTFDNHGKVKVLPKSLPKRNKTTIIYANC